MRARKGSSTAVAAQRAPVKKAGAKTISKCIRAAEIDGFIFTEKRLSATSVKKLESSKTNARLMFSFLFSNGGVLYTRTRGCCPRALSIQCNLMSWKRMVHAGWRLRQANVRRTWGVGYHMEAITEATS